MAEALAIPLNVTLACLRKYILTFNQTFGIKWLVF